MNRWYSLLVVTGLLLVGSAAQTFGQNNPVPFVNLPLNPGAVTPGSPGFKLTVNGTNFVKGSVVNWNGSALVTTAVSSSKLTATVPAASVAVAGTASVTVSSPAPGGGTSNVAFFDVTVPVVALTSTSVGPQTWIGFSKTDLPVGAGTQPSGIVAGNFSESGKLDLVTANQGSNTVSVLLGNGDGTFQAHVDYNVGAAPIALATGDFNGDGHLDLAVANSGGNTISILLGNGDGTFQPAQPFSVGNAPQWIAVADLNGDGKLDLAVPNATDNTVSILLGKGDGTFPTHTEITVGTGPASVAVGDFNRDGNLDLVVANYTANTVLFLMGDGSGNFTAGSLINNLKSLPHSVTVGDFDGDGNLDVAICNTGNAVPGGSTLVAYGKGDGTFPLPFFAYSTGNSPTMELTADLNGDGILDLITDNLSVLNKYSYLIGTGGRNKNSFQFHVNYPTGAGPLGVVAGDFNNDGMLDIAAADSQANTVSIMTQVAPVQPSPASLIFGNWAVGSTSNAQKVTITNNTSASVAVASIVTTGDFVQHGTCKSIGPVGPNGLNSCTFQVVFAPTALGVRSGSIAITEADNTAPLMVSLTGTGVAPVTLTPVSTNFGNVEVGSASPARNFTLTNNLTTAITISSIATTSSPAEFSQTNTCGTGLAARGKCTISVTFAPTVAGKITGSLSVSDSAGNSPQTAAILGTGTR
jgi:hypothetical protein